MGAIWKLRRPLERALQSGRGRLAGRVRPSFGLEVRGEEYDSLTCQDPFPPELYGRRSLWRGRAPSQQMAVGYTETVSAHQLSRSTPVSLPQNSLGTMPRSRISDPEWTSMRFLRVWSCLVLGYPRVMGSNGQVYLS